MTAPLYRASTLIAAVVTALGAAPTPTSGQGTGAIRGTVVSSANRSPIASAQIFILGSNRGSRTNENGEYNLTGIADGTYELRARHIGFAEGTQTVVVSAGATAVADFTLERRAVALDEVTITAFGIQQEQRKVPYAVSHVNDSLLVQAAPPNLESALYGKAAGLKIAQNVSGPIGGSNLTIRGVKSITGSSRPLIIVDGVPIHDSESGYSEVGWIYNRDLGTGINDINPNDVESVEILKGASASALYGAQAANGVILITTKEGRKIGGMGIEVSSSATFDKVAFLPEFQNEYGAGYGWSSLIGRPNDGTFRLDPKDNVPVVTPSSGSFGPKMEGQMVRWWDGQMRPFSPQPDNLKDLFQAGHNAEASVAFSNSLDRARYRLGYTRKEYRGTLPGVGQDRSTLNLTGNLEIAPRLRTELSLNYFSTGTTNPPPKWYMAYSFARSVKTDLLKQYYKDPQGYRFNESNFPSVHGGERDMMSEIFWTQLENQFEHHGRRLLGSLGATYAFTDWLNLRVTAGADGTNSKQEEKDRNIQPLSQGPSGSYTVSELTNRVTYGEAIATARRDVNPNFSLDVLAGAATTRNYDSETAEWTNGGLVARDWFSINNSKNEPGQRAWRGEDRTDGVFGSATVSYRRYLSLTASGRNDWTSTLPPGNNSYFYPSVGLSFVFSDAFRLPSQISYGKLRANYAEVGHGAQRYQANNVYNYGTWEGVTVNWFSTVVPPLSLKPERKLETELGLNMGFLQNRVDVDASWYQQRNVDQIINLGVAHSSGATAITVNNGLMKNSGLELQLNATPVRGNRFEWNTIFNYARNRNEIVRLASGVESIVLTNVEDNLFVEARPGRPYGEIFGYNFRFAPDGQRIIGQNGLYTKSDTLSRVGNITPTWTGGLINTLRYKRVSLTGVIDMRFGGDIIAMTNYYGYATGKWKETLFGRDEAHGGLPYYVDANGRYVRLPSHSASTPNGETVYHDGIMLQGVQEVFDASGNVTGYKPNDQVVPVWDYYSINYEWKGQGVYPQVVYDNSYIKFRELALRFDIPQTWLRRTGAQSLQLSLVGRNLFYLRKNVPHIDPESAISTDERNQGFQDYHAYFPSTRSIGFRLLATF